MIYICDQCRKEFKAPPSQKARFCSRDCYDKFRRGLFKCDFCGKLFIYYKSHKRGKKIFCSRKCHWNYIKSDYTHHPNWKGRSYRKMLEKHLNRKLVSAEIVHHINGNHSDNRIENLTITTRANHVRLHPNISPFTKGHKPFPRPAYKGK